MSNSQDDNSQDRNSQGNDAGALVPPRGDASPRSEADRVGYQYGPGYGSPQTRGNDAGTPLTVDFFVRSFLRWWKVSLPLGLVLAALAALSVMSTFTKQYQATALVQIEEQKPSIVFQSGERSSRYVQTQVELLRSPVVLGPVLGRPEVASIKEIREQSFPLRWLQRRVRVRNINKSELFEVSFTNHDPEAAARLVNEVISTYLDIQSEAEYRRNLQVIDLLRKEKQDRQDAVDELRQKVKGLAEKVTGVDLFSNQSIDPEISAAYAELTRLRQRIAEREVQRQMLEMRIKAFEQQSDEDFGDVMLDQVKLQLSTHPEVLQQEARIEALRQKLESIREQALNAESTPAYANTQDTISEEEQALKELKVELAQSIRESRSEAQRQSRNLQVAQLKYGKQSNEAELEFLRKQYEDKLQTLGKTEGKSIELEFARSELAREERVFEMIAQRKLTLETENDAPARVYLRKEATVPPAAIEEMPYKHLVLFSVAAFLLPFAAAIGWERIARRIHSPEQLTQDSNLTVLGEIARLPSQVVGRRGAGVGRGVRRQLSLFEECIDSLRTCLFLSEEVKGMQVLAVTSATSGEGKTTLSSQLAISIARTSQQPTLLIDGDMRYPDLHEVFEVPRTPGLADVLAKEQPLARAIANFAESSVHLLPAGKLTGSPHNFVGNEAFAELVEQLRGTYRYIIIDTPPILGASEALLMANVADGALFCTMRDQSRSHQVKAACQRLLDSGARPIGAVLSGTSMSQYSYRYGNYPYVRH